jgi:exopolysaccharide production protein ExoQ
MAIASHNGNLEWNPALLLHDEQWNETPIWEQISSWLILLPTLFITVSGKIQMDSGPVAFRFTAMEEDSMGRRAARFICLLLMLLLMSTHTREIIAVCKRSKLLLFLPALAFASVLWSQNPKHTLIDSANLLLTTLFAIYLYQRYPGNRIVSFLAFSAFVSLMLCVGAVILFPSVGIDALQQNSWRGIFGQRNNCAAICTLFLIVGLHVRSRGAIEQLMQGSIVVLSLLFIVMSGSRTGFIAAAIALALTYGLRFIARIRSLDRVLFLMVLTIPLALVAYLIGSNFGQILAAMDKDPTLTQRTIIWAQVVPSILKHPFLGYGYSAYWAGLNGESSQAVLTTGWMEGQAQDGYLDILLQLGIVGLIPVVALFIRGLLKAVAAVDRKRLNHAVMLAITLLPLILIENIGESSLLLPLGIPWLYALLAFVILNSPVEQVEVS